MYKMLARYVNEKQIERYKGYVIIDGITYANNEEKAREVGFKDLIIDEQPEYDIETEWLDYYYEDGDVIHQRWKIEPIEYAEERIYTETDEPIEEEPSEDVPFQDELEEE